MDELMRVALAVDLVVLTVRDDALQVLLVDRGIEPFAGQAALPGGFVLPGERLQQAAERELAEETGVRGLGGHIEQLATYADPDRDPRGRVVSVAYLALVPDPGDALAGSDAANARWEPAPRALGGGLAFDHAKILADGVERARAKLEYTPLAMSFVRHPFTVNELRRVYEVIWGAPLDPRNFHRKVTRTDDFIVATDETTIRGGGRPARLYRPGGASLLHPAMLRDLR